MCLTHINSFYGIYLVPRRRVLCGEVEEELLHVPVEQRLQVHLEVERQIAEIILKKGNCSQLSKLHTNLSVG